MSKTLLISILMLIGSLSNINVYAEESPSLIKGKKIYIHYCTSCHGDRGDGRGFNAKNLDPRPADHTDLASRLKRPWVERWLRDPQSIKPDVRMPRFNFKDWEFQALTNYIMTLGQYRFVTVKQEP